VQPWTRTHLQASVRWTLAGTSSKTGAYIYFLLSDRKKKMQIESNRGRITNASPAGGLSAANKHLTFSVMDQNIDINYLV